MLQLPSILKGLTSEEKHTIDDTIETLSAPQSRTFYYGTNFFKLCMMIRGLREAEKFPDKSNQSPDPFEQLFKILDFIAFPDVYQQHKWAQLSPQLLEKRIEEFSLEVKNQIELYEKTPMQTDPYNALYFKMLINTLYALKDEILPSLAETAKEIQHLLEMPHLQDDFKFDLMSQSLQPIFDYSENKEWLDLGPVYYYFQNDSAVPHPLASHLDAISRSTVIKNKSEVIARLNDKLGSLITTKDNPALLNLQTLIEAYHNIDKSDQKKIYLRNRRLLQISNLAKAISETDQTLSETQINTLHEISLNAKQKAQYLRKIAKIPDKTQKIAFRLAHVRGMPLVVDKIERLTDLDPAHRKANLSYNTWLSLTQNTENSNSDLNSTKSVPSYWMWMESLPRPELFEHSKDPRYQVDKAEKLVTIKDGRCYNQRCSNRPDGLIEDGIYLYNIDKNDRLYILPTPAGFRLNTEWGTKLAGKGKKDNIAYNHNSVLNGKSVKCPGCVCFVDGKIVHIDTNSGHYRPRMWHLQSAIKNALLPLNIFAEDAVVTDYETSKVVPVQSFASDSFNMMVHFPQDDDFRWDSVQDSRPKHK